MIVGQTSILVCVRKTSSIGALNEAFYKRSPAVKTNEPLLVDPAVERSIGDVLNAGRIIVCNL